MSLIVRQKYQIRKLGIGRTSYGQTQRKDYTADEIGECVAWLASDEAYMVNGSIIRLNEQIR